MQPLTPDELKHFTEVSDDNLTMHQETKNISYKAINNIIFLVSTGTLVLSVTLIGYLKNQIIHPSILLTSWFLLILTIIGNYTVHRLQINQSRRQIELINNERAARFPHRYDFPQMVVKNDKTLNRIIIWGKRISSFVIFSLSLGLFGLFWFGSINIVYQNDVRELEIKNQRQKDNLSNELIQKQIDLLDKINSEKK